MITLIIRYGGRWYAHISDYDWCSLSTKSILILDPGLIARLNEALSNGADTHLMAWCEKPPLTA